MKRVLVVCTENANRRRMAEAFARIHGRGTLEAVSAGSRPSGKINRSPFDASTSPFFICELVRGATALDA